VEVDDLAREVQRHGFTRDPERARPRRRILPVIDEVEGHPRSFPTSATRVTLLFLFTMRRPLLRSLLTFAVAGLGAGCSLLVSVDGLTGEATPTAARDGAADMPDGSAEAGTGADAGSADASVASTYIAVVGGASDNNDMIESTVWISRIAADGSLEPWSTTLPFVEPRERGGLVWTGTALTVVGGLGPTVNTGTPYFGILDGGAVARWKAAAPEPATSYARTVAVTHASRVYSMCGYDGAVEVSRVVSAPLLAGDTFGAWETTSSTPLPCSNVSAAVSGEHVYLLAGGRNASPTSVGWVGDFAPSGGIAQWRQLPDLPGTRASSALAAAASDTHVYASGGYTNGPYEWVSSATIGPDGMLGAWSDVSSLPVGRAGMSLVIARGRLYAIGGSNDANAPANPVRALVEVADILSDGSLSTWRETTPLPAPRQFQMAVAFTAP
jgi:hypothetical protein